MIDLSNVSVSFGAIDALRDIDLHVEEGEFVTVIGPSGCGKTTLLRTVGGLRTPTRGRVRLDGCPPDEARSEGEVGVVFQQHTLLPWKTAVENVVFLRQMAGKTPDSDGARELLSTVGLDGFEDRRPAALSGGMKQRVAIARALHLGANVLLMDEPFGGLDELTRDEIGLEVLELWRRERKTVLFVTHSVPEAVLLGDRCVVMADDPGTVRATFDIDLPRPRDGTTFETDDYQRSVAAIRRSLHDR